MQTKDGPVIVLDLETQNTFSEVGGKQNLRRLKVSVVGIYDYTVGTYSAYTEDRLLQLERELRSAGLLIGFNIKSFDLRVLQNYFLSRVEELPVLDLLEEIERVRGHRVTLGSIAEATFNERKTGHGLDAVKLFKEGRWQELTDYCLNDVRLTKEIYEYGKEKGKVYFRSTKDFQVHEVPVTWGRISPRQVASVSSFPTSLF